MKKTLLSVAFALAFNFGFAQQTISFETTEGFTLGNINTQVGWVTTATNEAGTTFVEGQVVSSDESSNGTNSFKLTTESAFPGQENPVVGGFYTLGTPVAREGATVSFDFKITDDFNMEGNDYRFALSGADAAGDLFISALVQVRFNGNIAGVNNSSQFENFGPTWTTGQWFNIKMVFTGNQVAYYLNNTLQSTFNVLTEVVNFTSLRIVHDNFGGTAYIDNIRINDEPTASADSFNQNSFKHFVNENGLNISSELELSNVELFNTIGQSVSTHQLNATTGVINLNNLSSGVYVARIQTTNGQSTSVKFVKN